MSWIEDLYYTYENNKAFVGMPDEVSTLFPIAHSTQNAQAEIVIDVSGNFRRAELVEKVNAVTMIPVTEDSASRGNGIAPHPLCDKLVYIAKDYETYTDKKGIAGFHEAYMLNLKKWCESPHSHPKVDAIFRYLQKGSVIQDMINCDTLKVDDNEILSQSIKVQNISQPDFFVRFRVENSFADDNMDDDTATWNDISLAECFVDYYCSIPGSEDLCFVRGELTSCSDKHPSKIRHSGDKAKLISSNDTSGFTFRGNYAMSGQLLSIGYETSQKAHNALRWILQKQGYKRVSIRKNGLDRKPEFKKSAIRSVVAWEVHDLPIPQPTDSSDEMMLDIEEFLLDEDGSPSVSVPLTQQAYGDRITRAIEGYARGFQSLDIQSGTDARVVVIAVDAATTGRLAVTYYQRIEGSSFLNRMKAWYNTCFWEFTEKVYEKSVTYVKSPSLKQIATLAFGTEQGSFVKIGNDSFMRSQVERLIPCVIDGVRIPRDIIQAMVNRTSMPHAYEFYNWRDLLAASCALIRKDLFDSGNGEDWGTRLNSECTDRNYLFGRLLAVADRAEFSTYGQGENRQTNAKQLFFSFVQKPQHTWFALAQKLQKYFSKMPLGIRRYFEKWIAKISSKISFQCFNEHGKLMELYLLGYYHQGMAMRKKSDDDNNDIDEIDVKDEKEVLIEKSHNENESGIDDCCLDRSYLFGRLMAIADHIEEQAMEFDNERTTLVKHHFAALMQRPASTWKYVFSRLQPYLSKLSIASEQNYYIAIERIYQLITDEQDAGSDMPLECTVVLGFYQQKNELFYRKNGVCKQSNCSKYRFAEVNEGVQSRDYIYGRLFAIADWIELLTFEQNERRDTNTRRLFSVLPVMPREKWRILKEREQVYLRKLGRRKTVFESMIREVEEMLPQVDCNDEIPLSPVYLQGFFHQRMVLRMRYPKVFKQNS